MAARILVIEDNEANLDLMAYLLRAFGHHVSVARDGAAGLAAVQAERPDLVLCDIHLPGIGGIEVAGRLRGDAGLRRIPLVAVTAFAMAGDRERILTAGFDGCLTKPITPETFVAQVEAHLPAQLHGGATWSAPAPLAPQPLPAQRGRTILAVDDRPENLELAAGILEPSGYRVVSATSMRAALALALELRPDLILSDVVMTDGSGYEFIHAVKADPRLRRIPFIFITATLTTPSARKHGLALGAARYLFRPIEPPELLREIRACLGEPP